MIKVLVVDDDKLARKGLISLMNWEKYGMQVVGNAQNGKIALDIVKNEPVDLVFVDIDMPEMNGLEFMERCHQMNDHVQFVVLSFYERFDYVQSTLRLGGLDYLSKTSMDLENCDEVLERIRKKYDEKKGTGDSLCTKSMEDDTESELRTCWKSLYWIFDDDFWEKMKEQIIRNRIDVRRLELMVSNCIGELEYLMGVEEKRMPIFENAEELIEWVAQYRRGLFDSTRTLPQDSDFKRIANTVSYIKDNFAKDISTTEVAARIGVSRSYFCTAFKKWVGMSFGDYLQRLRIEHAKDALEKTDSTVSKIAFSCGYNDIYYFGRVFRKAVGCTPLEYRNLKKV